MGCNGRREEGGERGYCILGYLIAFVGLRRRWVLGISSIHCSCSRRLQWIFSYVSLYHIPGNGTPDHLRSSLFVSLEVSEQIDFACRKWMERSRLNGSSVRVNFGMWNPRIKKAIVFHHRKQELQDPA